MSESKKVNPEVKVLGMGCASCRRLFENTCRAAEILELDAEVEYITDIKRIAEYGIMSVPALVVNGDVVSVGRIPDDMEIAEILKKY